MRLRAACLRRLFRDVRGKDAEGPASLKRVGEAGARRRADVAQLAEHVLGKDEVTSSILVIGSRNGLRERLHT